MYSPVSYFSGQTGKIKNRDLAGIGPIIYSFSGAAAFRRGHAVFSRKSIHPGSNGDTNKYNAYLEIFAGNLLKERLQQFFNRLNPFFKDFVDLHFSFDFFKRMDNRRIVPAAEIEAYGPKRLFCPFFA
jgi:hypothetical protein